jgi:hypothetical protein
MEEDRWGEQRAPTLIRVDKTSVHILDLVIESRDVAQYLHAIPEEDRGAAVSHLIELGVHVIESVNSTQSMEFVRRQVEGLLAEVVRMPEIVERALREKVGDGKGQILEPIKRVVETSSGHLKDLVAKIDPGSDASTLGRVLKVMSERVDPKRKDSIQATLVDTVTAVAGPDGALARTVKQVLHDALAPMRQDVAALARVVEAQQAVSDALSQTTKKGATYEEDVVARLSQLARGFGASIEHTGPDNQPGDATITFHDDSSIGMNLTIVVEAKDQQTPAGRKRIVDTLERAMATRNAAAGLYISKTEAGLGKDVSGWAEGTCRRGPYVATTDDGLILAVRWLVQLHRLSVLKASMPVADVAAIEAQVDRVHVALKKIQQLNRKAGDAKGAVDEIQKIAIDFRDEIQDAMAEIKAGLRVHPNAA